MNQRLFITVILLFVTWLNAAFAENRFIVRTSTGEATLQNLCRMIGCRVTRGLGDPQSQLFLITTADAVKPEGFLDSLARLPGIANAEVDLPVSLLPQGPVIPTVVPPIPAGLFEREPVSFYGSTVWNGYSRQPAADIVRVHEAHTALGVQGAGVVAVIDTGVDPLHPALRTVLVPGYDFTRDQAGMASETADVNQSTAAVVDGTPPTRVNDSTVAVVDQSTAAVVDDSSYSAFGHGTMVAGIVHMAAPSAGIMPLKAFRADGWGYTSDILRAIYWAIRSNARVLNMSFSMTDHSRELQNALDFAVTRQVVCVASAGNGGTDTLVYPAAFDTVMGVASTDMQDRRSGFSNYGDKLVWVAAPGEAIISTYPYGTYAASWGTSFSAPFVAGTAALLLQVRSSIDQAAASKAIANAKPIDTDMGNGRLDVYRAVQSMQNDY